jgi:endonuclease/exonuclease/phosphatase family metal-dependent hydrolase
MSEDGLDNLKRRLKRLRVGLLWLVCIGVFGVFAVPWALTGPSGTQLKVHSVVSAETSLGQRKSDTLRVFSLNLAHGRRDGDHQVLQSSDAIRSHLDGVAAVLRREAPDLVALQEADGASFWSGRFDHVEHVAREGAFAYFVHGYNVRGPLLRYGTAIVSQLEPVEPVSRTFAPSPPTMGKGLVIGTFDWPGNHARQVDVVSIHFDYARARTRQSQVRQIVDWLRGRGRPLIMLGDFNCDFNREEASLRTLAAKLRLHAFEPTAEQTTFPATGERLDWILISSELEFVDYQVLPDVLSDHTALVAKIKLHE